VMPMAMPNAVSKRICGWGSHDGDGHEAAQI